MNTPSEQDKVRLLKSDVNEKTLQAGRPKLQGAGNGGPKDNCFTRRGGW